MMCPGSSSKKRSVSNVRPCGWLEHTEPFRLSTRGSGSPEYWSAGAFDMVRVQYSSLRPMFRGKDALLNRSSVCDWNSKACCNLQCSRRDELCEIFVCRAPGQADAKALCILGLGMCNVDFSAFPRETRTASFWGNQRRPVRATSRLEP